MHTQLNTVLQATDCPDRLHGSVCAAAASIYEAKASGACGAASPTLPGALHGKGEPHSPHISCVAGAAGTLLWSLVWL